MPNSISGSIGSSSSAGRSRYRTVRRQSEVDDSLFGSPRGAGAGGVPHPHGHARGRKDRGEIIQVVTKDSIRKLRAHVPRPSDDETASIVLSAREFGRIKESARIVTRDEEILMAERARDAKAAAREASVARKEKMMEYEAQRRIHERLSDLDQEAAEKNNYLLAKARQQIDEEQDEVKYLNEQMLYAKCVSIRDAQVEEKKQIIREREEEERRLDAMMEVERLKALEQYEERERARYEEMKQGAAVIRQQINERKQERLMEAELKDMETRAMLKHLDDLALEDKEKQRERREQQRVMMDEVAKSNAAMLAEKQKEKDKERREDKKISEYLQDKEQREAEYQAEQERLQRQREKEIARLYKMQKHSKDTQSERDELRAKRALEQYERQWRKKEKSDLERHAKATQELIQARKRQVEEKQHQKAVQAHRDRREFERVIKVQKAIEARDYAQRENTHQQRMLHAQEVRAQIREKEALKIEERQNFFAEGERNKEESREIRDKLDLIRERKLAELREAGVPEKYCKEVERRIHLQRPTFSNSAVGV